MYEGHIKVNLVDGSSILFVNKNLAKKTGKDEYDNTILSGEPGLAYWWTGEEPDTYDKQTGVGKIKGDYENLLGQVGSSGLVSWPGESPATELVRHNPNVWTAIPANNRIQVRGNQIISVEVKTGWISSPANDREGAERLPRSAPEFQGTNEYANIRKENLANFKTIKVDEKTGWETKLPQAFVDRNPIDEKRERVKEGQIYGV